MDLSLSELGQRQAAAVGEFLAPFTIDHVYASPLKRARETAAAIAGHHQLDVKPVEDITECNVGEWEGKNWDTIMREFPDEYRRFMDDPSQNPYVGGETYSDVLRRAKPALESLLEKHLGEVIAVVAHNVVNRVYLAELLRLDLRLAKDVRQSNACVNVIRYRRGETELLTLNAVFHLDGLVGI